MIWLWGALGSRILRQQWTHSHFRKPNNGCSSCSNKIDVRLYPLNKILRDRFQSVKKQLVSVELAMIANNCSGNTAGSWMICGYYKNLLWNFDLIFITVCIPSCRRFSAFIGTLSCSFCSVLLESPYRSVSYSINYWQYSKMGCLHNIMYVMRMTLEWWMNMRLK